MDSDIRPDQLGSDPHLPPFEEISGEDLRHQSPEQIVATNVSQELLSKALDQQKHDFLSEELPPIMDRSGQPFGEPLIEEPIHQNLEYQSEQRFSGHPIQQYIYDEEEEDEEEEEEEEDDIEFDRHPIGGHLKEIIESNVKPKTETIDDLMDRSIGSKKHSNEEILYQLSDDNVLTAQSYGIGSDLRIGSHSDQTLGEVSIYELNSEDPFSTPQKQRKEIEETFERFVDNCEPFETITTDLQMSSERDPKNNLLELDSSLGFHSEASDVQKESHPLVESMSGTESEPNHALSTEAQVDSDEELDVLPSSAHMTYDDDLNALQTQSSNRTLNPIISSTLVSTQSPNLDTFDPTLTQTSHPLEDLPQEEYIETTTTASQQPIEPLFEKKIIEDKVKAEEPLIKSSVVKQSESELIPETMGKKYVSEQEVTTSANTSATDDGNCCAMAELVYWRDPKKSGVVFGAGLVILLSLTFFSIISVVAYTSLAILSVTLSFRIYKNILQAVQKTSEGHPFKEYLEVEITPSSERIHQIVDSFLSHINCTVNKLRSVFLVEDIIDSLKFAVLFWCLTYIGSWFNGLTLVILAYLGLFSIPKVYELNKSQIDHYLSLASNQINDITSKVKAKIPFPSAKKEKDN